MLLLTRKPGQGLTIGPDESLDLSTPIGRLFADGPIRVVVKKVDGEHVRLGVVADSQFLILREELYAVRPGTAQIDPRTRRAFARKLKVLRLLRKHTPETLAQTAGISLATVLGAENGTGVMYIDDLERLALALGVNIAELFREPGSSPEEQTILSMLRET